MRFGNTIRKIPVILEEIKIQSKKNGYILKIVNGVKVSETERKKRFLQKIISLFPSVMK